MLPKHVTPFEVFFGRKPYFKPPPFDVEASEQQDPLNADDDTKTPALILSEIKKVVLERNSRQAEKIR